MKNFERLKESVEGMVILENGLDENIPDWTKTIAVDSDGSIFAYESDVYFSDYGIVGSWLPKRLDAGLKLLGYIEPPIEQARTLKFNISKV